MLVTGADVLKLDANWLTEPRGLVRRGAMSVWQAQWAIDQLDTDAALLERLPDRRVVGKLPLIDVSTRWKPQPDSLVAVQEDALLIHHEDRDGELADQTCRTMIRASASEMTAITIQAGSPDMRHSAAPAITPTLSPATPINARRRRPPKRGSPGRGGRGFMGFI